MLVRTHAALYSPRFEWTRKGLLIVTKRLIIATGRNAYGWSN